MKFKINWGTGIVIAMGLFMIFILQFVYRASAVDKYNHQLVTDDYYGEEIHFQDEINKEQKGLQLPENVKIEHEGDGLTIVFPDSIGEPITGMVLFRRMSNDKLDFNFKIEDSIRHNKIYISDKQLVEGKYNIKVEWTVNGETYLYKENLFY